MYNIFRRPSVLISIRLDKGSEDRFIEVHEFRVYKADNKNTLRRLRGERWTKIHDLSVCDRKVAVVVVNKMVKEQEKRLAPILAHLEKVRERNKKL